MTSDMSVMIEFSIECVLNGISDDVGRIMSWECTSLVHIEETEENYMTMHFTVLYFILVMLRWLEIELCCIVQIQKFHTTL